MNSLPVVAGGESVLPHHDCQDLISTTDCSGQRLSKPTAMVLKLVRARRIRHGEPLLRPVENGDRSITRPACLPALGQIPQALQPAPVREDRFERDGPGTTIAVDIELRNDGCDTGIDPLLLEVYLG